MKNILRIMNKELRRVFTNKRMMISLILPGIIIFALYSAMGSVVNKQADNEQSKIKTTKYNVYAVNMPDDPDGISIKNMIENAGYTFNYSSDTIEQTDFESLVINGDLDLILVFDEDFVEAVEDNLADPETNVAPEVTVYYNPGISQSLNAFNIYSGVMNAFQIGEVATALNRDDVNIFTTHIIPFVDQNKAMGDLIATIFPLILIALLFSGCVAVTPEAIAGEKERGTMATLLSTPVKRPQIAVGKVLALAILATIGALSSFLGIMFSLPKLLGTGSIFSIYSFGQIFLVFLVLVATVLLIVSILSIVSAFSQNVKEATMLSSLFLVIGLVFGLINMFMTSGNVFFFLIPVANTAAVISSILSFNVSYINLAVTIVANLAYTALLVFGLSKMFNNEKIMFTKG